MLEKNNIKEIGHRAILFQLVPHYLPSFTYNTLSTVADLDNFTASFKTSGKTYGKKRGRAS